MINKNYIGIIFICLVFVIYTALFPFGIMGGFMSRCLYHNQNIIVGDDFSLRSNNISTDIFLLKCKQITILKGSNVHDDCKTRGFDEHIKTECVMVGHVREPIVLPYQKPTEGFG